MTVCCCRKNFWTTINCLIFHDSKKVDLLSTTGLYLKLKNEGLHDLHEVLHIPFLQTEVGKMQLHCNIGFLAFKGLQKDFDLRKELVDLLGNLIYDTIMQEIY